MSLITATLFQEQHTLPPVMQPGKHGAITRHSIDGMPKPKPVKVNIPPGTAQIELMHRNRKTITRLIASGARLIETLVEQSGLSKSGVCLHLNALEEADAITIDRSQKPYMITPKDAK